MFGLDEVLFENIFKDATIIIHMVAKLNYTSEDCLRDFRELYENHGIAALNEKWLKCNNKILYSRAEKILKRPLETIAKGLGVFEEYNKHKIKKYCSTSNRDCWTDEKIHETIQEIIENFQCFPSQLALKTAGYKGFLSAIFRRGITVASIKKKYCLTERFSAVSSYLFIFIHKTT